MIKFSWFFFLSKTEKAIELLLKFELIGDSKLDLNDRYHTLLKHYGKDLETVRKLYQKQKLEPALARNMPPVAGRILWARHLYRRIERPMKLFRNKPAILKVTILKLFLESVNLNLNNVFLYINIFWSLLLISKLCKKLCKCVVS